MSKRKRKNIHAKVEPHLVMNDLVYIDYYTRLKEYAINTFEWVNLPDTVDARYMELILCERGKVCFFEDELVGFMALPVNEYGNLNVYNYPTEHQIYAVNGYNKNRNIENSVVIYNNYLRLPTVLTLSLYAERLSKIQRTIDVNISACKTPYIIVSTENQQLALENAFKQIDENRPAIFFTNEMNLDNIKALDLKTPYVSDKLTLLKHDVWNEAMTFLGIENSNTDKKERMITDEVNSNDGQIEASRFNMLDARLEACDKINKMFNLNISCKFRNDNVQKAYEKARILEAFPVLDEEDVDNLDSEVVENE